MNRREFGKRIALGSGSVLAGSGLVGTAPAAAAGKPEQSPHVEALALVFRKAAARIQAMDKENWWFDVKERAWDVQRPFSPGYIDSTHLFTVSYQIGNKPVAAWQVDTRSGKVKEIPPARREPRTRETGSGPAGERPSERMAD
jgi:hypothetical protein